jgi:carbamoyltransferase
MNILGISYSHEASACIFINDCLTAAAAEERFTRLKMEMGYPKNAIRFCLEFAGIDANDLDLVVIASENDPPDQYITNRISTFSVDDFIREQNEYWKPKHFEGKDVDYLSVFSDKIKMRSYDLSIFLKEKMSLADRIKKFREIRINTIAQDLNINKSKIIHVNHEKSHAFYGLYANPVKDKTLVFTCEGWGDYSNGTVSIYENNSLKELSYTSQNRLGHLYKFITLLLGMKPSQHEYKVMGLAPYANTKEVDKAYRVFKDLFMIDGLNVGIKKSPDDFYFWFRKNLEGCRFDGIAGALQRVTEETMVEWVRHCCRKLDVSNVVISGGVSQNIKSCLLIGELDEVENIYVAPSSGDGSLSIGACYYILDCEYEKRGWDKRKIEPIRNIYLGPEYSSRHIDTAISDYGLINKYKIIDNIDNEYVVDSLLKDKVIARFSGRMEFGQRALGNRSIIANPKNPRMIKKLNTVIKFRDFWMPFTPTILAKFENDYIINPKHLQSSFMTLAFNTTEKFQDRAPAAIHPADDTARPQILKREHNASYYDLIKLFVEKTGTGAILNTSMNLHGEPMVCSPEDAIHTFLNSMIDILLFDHVLIARE